MNQYIIRPAVLLLPGNMCDARLWQSGDGAIIKSINGLGLAVEFVNFENDNSIDMMAARALGVVEGDVVPIGFSMGGIVALEMARLAPDRMRAIGLIDTTCHADTRGPERLRQQEDVRQGQLECVVVQELKPNYLAPCNASNSDLLQLLCDMAMDLGAEAFMAQSEALRTRNDLSPVLPSLTMPIFLACGACDTLCPPMLHQDMAAQCANAELHIIADAGHILPLEQPEILARLLSQFLSSALGIKP